MKSIKYILFLMFISIIAFSQLRESEIILGNYKGKIGDNLDVTFRLNNNHDKVTGFYYYDKIGVDINIVGEISGSEILLYELDYKNDTIGIIKANIKKNNIIGNWFNVKKTKKYSLNLTKTKKEVKPLPKYIVGQYYQKKCDFNVEITKNKGEYRYKLTIPNKTFKGKITFSRDEYLYLTFEGIEYAEDYFDITLFEEDEEKEKEFEKLKKIGKRKVGFQGFIDSDEITIQNYGNSMNYFVIFNHCSEKYIHLKKQNKGENTKNNLNIRLDEKTETLSSKDSLEILNLVRNVYKWKEKSTQLTTCFNIGLVSKNGKKYLGIDWKEYEKNAKLFNSSSYFSTEFVEFYKETLNYIDNKVKNNEYEWNVGEYPPFGTGANEWCHCQDYPIDNYWEKLEIQDIKSISKNKASLIWNWGKGIEWDWQNNKKGYPLKVIKENGNWRILKLDGFETKYY